MTVPGAGGTASERYALLEAEGRWFDGRTARPREVIVKFGKSSLTLLGADDTPLAHWALASLREIDAPGAAAGEMRLSPADDATERLALSDAEMIAAIRAACPDLRASSRPPGALRRALAWMAGAAAALALIVLVLIPALAERLAPLIPDEQAGRLGDAVVAQIGRALGAGGPEAACDDPAGARALDVLLARLGEGPEAPPPVRVMVLDHPLENAFAVPGGRIVLFRGLLEAAESPEEVAAVLAHEIGHVAHRDPTREALRSAGSAGVIGMFFGDFFGGAIVVAATNAVLDASYRQDAESAADAYAHALFAAAGLPAGALAGFFERMAEKGGAAPGLLSHIASHPDLASRAAAARAADVVGRRPWRPALSAAEWRALKGICG